LAKVAKIDFFQIFEFIQELLKSAKTFKGKRFASEFLCIAITSADRSLKKKEPQALD
jgi:uncharacterized tellurite resistance protein B-like protein